MKKMVCVLIISVLLCACSSDTDNSHMKKIEDNISMINEIKSKFDNEKRNDVVYLSSLERYRLTMAVTFEDISEEYKQLQSEENKQKILSTIENQISKETFSKFQKNLEFEYIPIEEEILSLFE